MSREFYRRWGKRFFDLLFAVPALIVLLPVIAVVAVVVRFGIGSPVLFRQDRPGLSGKPFTLLKFRTMVLRRNGEENLEDDEKRLTREGRWLRRTSLDELPELLNVVRGEMSLVGPRPLLMEYLDLYTDEQMRRHEVLPGITGWAQVNGRNALSWPEKFALDIWYVENLSLWLDVKILLTTVLRILQREGVNEPGQATARRFRGERG